MDLVIDEVPVGTSSMTKPIAFIVLFISLSDDGRPIGQLIDDQTYCVSYELL